MSDHCEAEDGQALAYEEAAKLHAMKPDHELLRYALRPDNDEVYEEFIARFGKPGLTREQQRTAPAVAYLYAKYYLALREACADQEKQIVGSHGL